MYCSICCSDSSGLHTMGSGVGSSTGRSHGTAHSRLVCTTTCRYIIDIIDIVDTIDTIGI